MDEFNYLSVPISIVIGLAITELLTRVGRVIQLRRRVRFFWPTMVWTGLVLVIAVQSWWALFGLRGLHDWTIFKFLVVLVHPLALFLLATLVLPDREEFANERVDLEEHYFTQHRWFFGAILVTILASLARPPVLFGGFRINADVLIQGFLFLLAAAGILVRAGWLHRLLPLVVAATIAGYISLLFVRL